MKDRALLGVILIAFTQLAGAGLQSAFAQPGRPAGFWDLFGESYQDNCRMWKHDTEKNPVIVDVGPTGSFDDADVLDPSAIEFHGKVMLYYSGVGTGPNSVGLAVSDDGEHFTKIGKVMKGRSPSAIVKDGNLHVFHRKTGKALSIRFLFTANLRLSVHPYGDPSCVLDVGSQIPRYPAMGESEV